MLWRSSSPTSSYTQAAVQAQRQLQSRGKSRSKKKKNKEKQKNKGISKCPAGSTSRDDQLGRSPTSPEPPSKDEHLQRLCTQGHFLNALDNLADIHTPLSTHTYLCLLKACICKKSIVHAKQIHAHILRHSISLCGFLGDYLVGTFAKCRSIEDAVQLSHTLPFLSASSWSAIISAHADSGSGHDAFETHRHMQENGVKPTGHTFVSLFKACGSVKELQYGRILHGYACCEGFLSNVFVGNTLVSMYGKCGALLDAENVFYLLPQRDDVTWSALLSACVHRGEEERTLRLFRQMLEDYLPPNPRGLACALQACSNLAEEQDTGHLQIVILEIGRAIHRYINVEKFLSDMFLQTELLIMYSKCGAFEEATNVFLACPQHDLVTWTAMLSVLVEQGNCERALLLYRVMQEEGYSPNQQTFAVALQACGMIAKREQADRSIALEIGVGLHTDACKNGYASNTHVGTALVNVYSVCRALTVAEEVFRSLSQPDIVTWNAMLQSYVEQGHGEKALCLYSQMIVEGVSPNPPTFVLALQACGVSSKTSDAFAITGALEKQICSENLQILHMDVSKKGYISNAVVGNALLGLYGKYGTIAESERVFDAVSEPNIVLKTAMLSVYGKYDQAWKALRLLREMLEEDSTLDEIAIVCMFQACKETGLLEVCRHLLFSVVSAGLEQLPSVAAASIATYGRAASEEDVDAILAELCTPDVLAWTACITGHTGGRDPVASLHAFDKLTLESFPPDEIAFTSLLAACCHAGLVAQGLEYFLAMSRDYKLNLEPLHYGILIDLLGRAGDLGRVEGIIARVSLRGETIIWLSVLGACLSHGNIELAKQAFDHSINGEQAKQWAAYVIMSNIYANESQEEQSLTI